MELKTESDQTQHRDRAIVYQAIGWMVGRYQPSADNPECGILFTEDGQTIPAQLSWQLHKQLCKKFGELVQTANWHGEKFLWTVYPRTEPLSVQLVNINLLQPPVENATASEAEQAKSKQADGLKIVGQIESVAAGKMSIIVRRNEKPPRGRENDVEYQPSVLQIVGSVPEEAVGQIWELEVQRQKAALVVVTGKPYTPVVTRLRARKRSRASAPTNTKVAIDRDSPLLKPIKRIKSQTDLPLTVVEQEEAAEQQQDSQTLVPPQSSASKSMQAATNAGTDKTVGKMEVVVKLNELPDDVKTVDKAWKEFDILAGELSVTITVKPKTFALLEQAQQAYPSWVAAISGQMGQMTAKGFKLESAAIKVFERKATGSSPSEDSTTKKSEPSPATRTSLAIAQPSEINLESKSLAQRVPNAESLHSPKTLPQNRLQQNQPAGRTGQPLSRTQAASASKQASFSVQVNAQVFVGHNSVTLNRRVLCIDGKPVAQGKVAVVIGQPKTMQADGSVTKGNDRSVLMSK